MLHRFFTDRDAHRNDTRVQRTIQHLECNILEKLITLTPDSAHLQESDFKIFNVTELNKFLRQLMTPEYDPFDETQTKINDPDVKINNGIQLILPKDEELGPEYKINNQDLTESQQSRHRRAIPIIPLLSAVGGSIAGSAVTSLALQNTKNAGTGLTESHIQLLKEFATEIAATKIDYQQVYKVINIVVVESLQNFEMQIMTNFDGVTALTMGLDLKGLNQNLQTIAQLTILKHNAALLAAADGRTSPMSCHKKT